MMCILNYIALELYYYAPETRDAIRQAIQQNKPEKLELSTQAGQAQDM